ncbi:MAG: aminoacyl-tRNA hydrolase [Mycoplasma sp.]|nr:aminoacyl-tRNA hydrolase [Mycoplasma sp.]
MKLIVGLGNPGEKYNDTKHNIGFTIIDKLCDELNIKLKKEKFNGYFQKKKNFIIAKPQTFMNLSGEFVYSIAAYFKIDPSDILVIHDDLDLEIGKVKVKTTGGHGGQNGIKNIIQHLGTPNFNRIKFGIGRPKNKSEVVKYVLSKFSTAQKEKINESLDSVVELLVEYFKTQDFKLTFNKKIGSV